MNAVALAADRDPILVEAQMLLPDIRGRVTTE